MRLSKGAFAETTTLAAAISVAIVCPAAVAVGAYAFGLANLFFGDFCGLPLLLDAVSCGLLSGLDVARPFGEAIGFLGGGGLGSLSSAA